MKISGAAIIAASLALSGPVFGQTDFDVIHGDIIRKLEGARAARAMEELRLRMPLPTPTQLQYDVTHYEVDIAIDDVEKKIEGRVRVHLESLTESLAAIDLDADVVLAITSVNVEGQEGSAWEHNGDILTISLPSPLEAGAAAVIDITYEGYPASAELPGLYFRTYGTAPVVYSLSEPWCARSWWPCKDYPDDKATFDIRLAVNPALIAASNGEFIGESDTTHWGATYRRFHWRENHPMANYLFSVAASVYAILEDDFVYAPGETMTVTSFIYPSKLAQAQIDLGIGVPALEFYSSIFGLYPYIDEKYGIALCGLGGGMEHQTLTSYGAAFITGTHQYDYLYVHELSHQWFGDLVTCEDWVHIWLNEGWASYCEALWFEHTNGEAYLRTYMEARDNPAYWNGPILRDPGMDDPWYYFDRVVYHKGAWVLHMLRHVVGDSVFFDAARAFLEDPRFRDSYADTDDLIGVFEEQYGQQLDWFFTQWLTREDRPEYGFAWDSFEAGGRTQISISVEQLQAGLYSMPVDLRITTAAATIDTVLWIDERMEPFHIAVEGPVTGVELDPDHWILRYINSIVTGGGIPGTDCLAQNIPNPFNPSTRIVYWLSGAREASLRIYDVSGALVREIARGHHEAGRHEAEWDGRDSRGIAAASGIYFYRLVSGSYSSTRKMVLLR